MYIVPFIISNEKEFQDDKLQEFIDTYANDLPNPDVLQLEFHFWKKKWEKETKKLDSLAETNKECNKSKFPFLYTLLKIGCALPISSCEC